MNNEARKDSNLGTAAGIDAPVFDQSRDFLNRWPFAKQIYSICSESPADWSTRVGVYGEWGTGKTSVLGMIEKLGERHGHIVLWFNPWRHSKSESLWNAFGLEVFKVLEARIGGVPEGGPARQKVAAFHFAKTLGRMAQGVNEAVVSACGGVVSELANLLRLKESDFLAIRRYTQSRRVIILIDDLDRTADELVPEILFALKEVMNVPGFSFVCGFDPFIVGDILSRRHPGIRDGSRFLEKIIDYPRWLPPAHLKGLIELAVADARQYCAFVPEQAIRDTIPLLPPAPRAVRQFIRILATLRPQIDRHYDRELRWNIILPATVIKVRYPRIAYALLSLDTIRERWLQATFGDIRKGKSEQNERRNLILEHVDRVIKRENLLHDQREEVVKLVEAACLESAELLSLETDAFVYQFHVTETAAAVTQKEFDEHFRDLGSQPKALEEEICRHAERVGRSQSEVYSDVAVVAIERYAIVLQDVERSVSNARFQSLFASEQKHYKLIRSLMLDSRFTPGKRELANLFENFRSIRNRLTFPRAESIHKKVESLLVDRITSWRGDVNPLMDIVNPYSPDPTNWFSKQADVDLQKKLRSILLRKFAEQVLDDLSQPNFVHKVMRNEGKQNPVRIMLLDTHGPLWTTFKVKVFKVLKTANRNKVVRENAYSFLDWCDGRIELELGLADLKPLLEKRDITEALWQAATARPLSPMGVARMHEFPRRMQAWGVPLRLPNWWNHALKESGFEPSANESFRLTHKID